MYGLYLQHSTGPCNSVDILDTDSYARQESVAISEQDPMCLCTVRKPCACVQVLHHSLTVADVFGDSRLGVKFEPGADVTFHYGVYAPMFWDELIMNIVQRANQLQ